MLRRGRRDHRDRFPGPQGGGQGEQTLTNGDGAPLVVTSQSPSDVSETFRAIGKVRLVWGVIFLGIVGAILAVQTGVL